MSIPISGNGPFPRAAGAVPVRFGRRASEEETLAVRRIAAASGKAGKVADNQCFTAEKRQWEFKIGSRRLFTINLSAFNLAGDLLGLIPTLGNREAALRTYRLAKKSFIGQFFPGEKLMPNDIYLVFKPSYDDRSRDKALKTFLWQTQLLLAGLKYSGADLSATLMPFKANEWRQKSTGDHIVRISFKDPLEAQGDEPATDDDAAQAGGSGNPFNDPFGGSIENLFEDLRRISEQLGLGRRVRLNTGQAERQAMYRHLETLGIRQRPKEMTPEFFNAVVKPAWRKAMHENYGGTFEESQSPVAKQLNAAKAALKAMVKKPMEPEEVE